KVTDPKGTIYLTNTYDTNGRVTKQTQADSTTYLFAYTIGANGKVSQTDVTDPRGNVRRVTFNTDGYVISDTFPVGKPEQQTISYVRDANTNLISSMTDGLNRRTSYTYDSLGNTASVTSMSGTSEAVTTSYTYDQVFSVVMSVTDPLNHTLSFGRDAKGNVTSITDPLNHQATIAYNSAGQVTSVTDPMLNTTTYGYEAGFVTSVTDGEGRRLSRFVDDAGRVLAVTNPQGNTVRYAYDAGNLLTKITDPNGGNSSFTYDLNGNLLTITDALNNVTTNTYNNMDRLTSRKDALLRTQSYVYDGNGNMTKYTDRRGKVTNYTYDNLNRLTFAGFGAVVQGQSTVYESTVTYTYDAGDRLTRTVDTVAGTMNLGYDNLDRLTSQSSPQGTVTYTYDSADRRTSMTVAGQAAVNYTYDSADRLQSITQGSLSVGFAFDNGNRLTSLTLPNGVRMDYSYNRASQLTAIAYKQGAATLGDLTYTYDAAGRRSQLGGSFSRLALPATLSSATYNANNQLTQRAGVNLTYDNNGNLTSDGTNTYTWNARNQLSAMSGAGLTASFVYDPFGRRVQKTVNGASTEFVYDGPNSVQEKVGGTPSANFLTGGLDQLFTRTDANGSLHFLSDGLGSTLGLTDAAGSQTVQYTYEPFGTTSATGSSGNTAQYGGRENDNTGLYFNRARYYSPKLQRFISEDPLGFTPGDTNLYSYVGNGPVNWADPLGLDKEGGSWLDNLQMGLDLAGFIPGLGDVLDLVNGAISLGRGDYVGAGLSAAAAIPLLGDAANAAGVARRATRFHHVFPQASDLARKFAKAGIDIDKYTLELPEAVHRCIHSGKGFGRGGKWNKAWKDFFDKFPNATAEDIYKYAGQLIHDFDIDGIPVVPYPRR
ncbi:MAG TPA: TIGR02269 family lipoprotein, partial [Pyrinomonadaceae bacterium]